VEELQNGGETPRVTEKNPNSEKDERGNEEKSQNAGGASRKTLKNPE